MFDEKLFRLVFPGNVMPGNDYDEVVFELARLLKTTPGSAIKLVSGVKRHVKRTFNYERADQLRIQVLRIGVECELEPVNDNTSLPKSVKRKRKKHFPKPENLAMKPAMADQEKEPGSESESDKSYSQTMAEFQKHAIEKRKKEPENIKIDDAGQSFIDGREQSNTEGNDGEAANNVRQRLAQYVGENVDKYLSKFDKFQEGGATHFAFTWHWPALFFPFFWAIYRKLWGWSVLIFVSGVLWPLSSVIWAMVANYIYFRHCKSKINSIRYKYPDEIEDKLSEKGGASKLALSVTLLIILLLLVGVFWTGKFAPVFLILSENFQQLEQIKTLLH